MTEFIAVLQAAGPFTAPLCIAMAFAMRYLVTALDKMEARAVTGETDAKGLRDKRTEELVAATRAMGAFGEEMRHSIEAHNDRIDAALAALVPRGR
jgi:hypothetical protein